jgi:DNA-directed RNA polymerase specialized sigma24 family protein
VAQAVHVRIARLPVDQQQALVHHYLEGRSVDETAAAMLRTAAAVRGLLFRGKQALREACGRSSLWLSRR